ncbi:DUF4214 domain-containing protein [Methylobacterium sp. WL12]|uniref:DUF4214 domain-containing protein n=1 Tax=Methylobacterium sp. WL12 TaxID=2603890 RepID=UPI0011CB74D9|nr:DUF4214 domain-containing protein [Methylobacterium sp. WL12]TXM66449.1 DUF4214 domain-containing protein [Methylobacterium sp. WL12]
MNGVVFYNGHRYAPSSLDLATLADIGVGTVQSDYLKAPLTGQTLDGGAGLDTLIVSGLRASGTVTIQSAISSTVTVGSNQISLINVERVAFADGTIALDIQGNAGQVYRLYKAAFDRAPDIGGLSAPVRAVDNGVSLHDDAVTFLSSPEFALRYGSAPTDQDFVAAMYKNVLQPPPMRRDLPTG